MNEILTYIPLLSIVILCNILCGTYYNISVQDIKFDKLKFISGAIKATIVGITFIGLAYVFDKMPELASAIGVTPKFLMVSAITIYAGKSLIALGKILGVDIVLKKES